MALTPKIFGIAANTVTITNGPTGSVIETFDIDAGGTEKILTGNNAGQTPVDVRTTEVKETASFTAEFETYVEPDSLIGADCTFSATSDDTTAAAPSVSGKIATMKYTGHKSDWWQYSITVTKVGA